MARSQFYRTYNPRDYPWYSNGPHEDFRNNTCLFKKLPGEKVPYHINPEWVSEKYSDPVRRIPRKYRPWAYEFHGARHYRDEEPPPYGSRPCPSEGPGSPPRTLEEEMMINPDYRPLYIKDNVPPWSRPCTTDYAQGDMAIEPVPPLPPTPTPALAPPCPTYEVACTSDPYPPSNFHYQSTYNKHYSRCFPCLPSATPQTRLSGIPIHRKRPQQNFSSNYDRSYMNFANIQWQSLDVK